MYGNSSAKPFVAGWMKAVVCVIWVPTSLERTGVLALKLSELEFIRSETGEYPILLLDDVMSELDGDRRSKLLEFIRRENIQTLITATDKAYFPNMSLGKYYHVSAGVVTEG